MNLYYLEAPLSAVCLKGPISSSINELSPLRLLCTTLLPFIPFYTTLLTLKCLCLGVISAWTQFGACTIRLGSRALNSVVLIFQSPSPRKQGTLSFPQILLYYSCTLWGYGELDSHNVGMDMSEKLRQDLKASVRTVGV